MSFIVKNTAFECFFCGEKNPPAPKTCRNHCRKCLSAVHLDDKSPGDRASECKGEMKVVQIYTHSKHEFVLEHECVKCKKIIKNKICEDDSREKIFEFLKKISDKNIFG